MIDIEKYEGHTPAPWRVENGSIHAKADWWSGAGDMIFFSKRHGQDANSQLIADAPLLLEAYKRLVIVADELYLHIVGEPHMTLDELVAEMSWRNEE